MKFASICLALVVATSPTAAADLRMKCANPRQEYLAVLQNDGVLRKFASGDNFMPGRVQGVLADGDGSNVAPAFKAQFGEPDPRIEFHDASGVFQIDHCKMIDNVLDLMGN